MNAVTKCLVAAITVFSTTVYAADNPDDAVAIVKAGLSYLEKNNKDALIKEVNSKNPAFMKGDVYLAIRATDGTTLAHPHNPKLIGKNLLPLPDADGKYFRKEIVDVAKNKGSGWVDYRYNNPSTNEIERKSIYLTRSGDIILEAGIYKGK